MSTLPTCNVPTNNIAALDQRPNEVGGLSASQLQALFDKFGVDLVAWLNATYTPQANALLAARLFRDGGDTLRGGLIVTPIDSPLIPTVVAVGTAGTTSYTYAITARTRVGETLISPVRIVGNGNATLTVANFNRITWTVVAGAVDYRVWRTASGGVPSTTGVIATTALLTVDDTGLVGNGAVVPTANNTAVIRAGAPLTADDVALLATVNAHASVATAHGAVSVPTPSTTMARDLAGRTRVVAGLDVSDAVNLGQLNAAIGGVAGVSLLTIGAPRDWVLMQSAPANVASGGSLAYTGGDFIYALQGGTATFWRYSISGNSWLPMTPAPAVVSGGGSLVYTGGDFIYAFQGGGQTTFWRYSISGNSWSTMTSTPAGVWDGGSLVYTGGDFIYALQGNTTTAFWRYSISGNSWLPMTPAPANVASGGSLAYTGGDFIYALQGGGQTAFWRYSISGNSWLAMTLALGTVTGGGSLVYTGADFIYAFRGVQVPAFWRYSISGNSWAQMPDALGNIGHGGSLTFTGGDFIYALQGNTATGFWRVGTPVQRWAAWMR